MQVNISLSLDTDRDAAILARIAWLKANKPRQVSAWIREMIRLGMARDGALEQKIDRVLALLESGMVVQAQSRPASEERTFDALDKLGL